MQTNQKTEAAVEELLREDSPEEYSKTLDLLIDAWISSNYTDNTTGQERALIFSHYKAMKRMFIMIENSVSNVAILALCVEVSTFS